MSASLLRLSSCTVNLDQGRVLRSDGALLRLTTREVELLRYLAAHPGQDVPREELLTEVWGYAETIVSRAVDSAISRLRTKLEPDPSQPVHLLTVHGAGYRLLTGAAQAPTPAATPEPREAALRLGEVRVELGAMRAWRGEGFVTLSAREVELLRLLAASPGRTWSRAALSRALDGREATRGRALDNLILRLRGKLEDDPKAPRFLETVHGKGYRLNLAPARPPPGALAIAWVPEELRGWEAAPEAWAEAMRQLRGLLQRLAVPREAAPVEAPDTVFRAAFPTLDAALAWACEAQLALLAEDWPSALEPLEGFAPVRDPEGRLLFWGPRVAMAVHALDAETPEPWWGPAAAQVRALAWLAQGGEVLTTPADLRGADAERWASLSVQEGPRGALSVQPRALAARRFSQDAPGRAARLDADAMLGRDALLTRALAHLQAPASAPLLLHGPGGVGKTRLARALEAALNHELSGGCWWCDLSEVQDIDAALLALQRTLALPTQSPTPERIGRALDFRGHAALVLDNVEQIDEGVGALAQQLREAAPRLRLVITSRAVVPGCHALAVPPLELADAEALFEARARLAAPAFEVATPARPALRALLQTLDRLPLAVRLAAAWMGSLSADELLRRLEQQHADLSGPGEGRHASLSRAVAWSWSRLAPPEVEALLRLSLFRGGFGLDAAEEVLELSERWPEAPGPLTLLQRLVDKSLVTEERGPRQTRYALYTAVLTYARGQAAQHPEAARAAAQAFCIYYRQFGRPVFHEALFRRGQAARRERLITERTNLQEAAVMLADQGEAEAAGRLVLVVGELYRREGPAAEGARLVTRALRAGPPTALEGELLLLRARLYREHDKVEPGQRDAMAAMALGEREGLPALIRDAASVLALLSKDDFDEEGARRWAQIWLEACTWAPDEAVEAAARIWIARHDPTLSPEARLPVLERGLEATVRADDLVREGVARWHLGRALLDAGRPGQARAVLREALRAQDDPAGRTLRTYHLRLLILALEMLGADEELEAQLIEGIRAFGEIGLPSSEAHMRARLALLLLRRGRLVEAEQELAEAERLVTSDASALLRPFIQVQRAEVLRAWGDPRGAADRLDQALEAYRAIGSPPHLVETLWHRGRLACEAGERALARRALAEAEGQPDAALTPEARICLALLNAHVAHAEGRRGDAERWLEEARRRMAEAGVGPRSETGEDADALAEALSRAQR
ncbi:MAG: winged helix-turn-helix domain-containing protein [Alphaproteobacteria bacterium]|nr:winged helix-turn-helix domain-containing protein [Alphaproteobacteria bacterium]